MPQDLFVDNRYRTFKWVGKHNAPYAMREICERRKEVDFELPTQRSKPSGPVMSNQQNAEFLITGIALAFLDKSETPADRRRKILTEYDRLLSRIDISSDAKVAFDNFYNKYKDVFERLHSLDDEYDKANSNLNEIKRDLDTALGLQRDSKVRSAGLYSNFQFHSKKADYAGFFSKSSLITGGSLFGIAMMMIGGFVLIPTIFTYLLPMPIVFLSIGVVFAVAGLVLALKDKYEAAAQYEQATSQVEVLAPKKDCADENLYTIWQRMQKVDFESVPPQQSSWREPQPAVIPSFS